MRALIIVSASRVTVIDPSRTCATNSLTRSLPRSLPVSLAMRPCSTIWSSRPFSKTCSVACGAALCFASAIGSSVTHFFFQLVQFVFIAHRVQQQFFQLIVALQAAAQVAQLGAQV